MPPNFKFKLLSLLFLLLACTPQQPTSTSSQAAKASKASQANADPNAVSLPPPIKAKYIDPDSLAPPKVVRLTQQPKVVPAHTNIHPVGEPEIIEIPEQLTVFTPGKNGVPLPKKIVARKKLVPASHPKPITALSARTKDAAIYDIQYLSADQGLPVVGKFLLQDSRGHIWSGNFGGAVRYDGHHFYHYTEKEGFLNGINFMMEDSKGNIWITADRQGVCYYDGQYVVYFTNEELDGNWWMTAMEDREGNIWLGGSKGVYRYDGQSFSVYSEENGLINNFNRTAQVDNFTYRIMDIVQDSRGHFWWATHGSGIMRYDGQDIVHYTTKEGLVSNHITSILEDSQGQIWFGSGGDGTTGSGVSRYSPPTGTSSTKHKTRPGTNGTFTNFTKEEGLSGNRVERILEDESGHIWFATYDGGVSSFDGKNFTHFTTEEGLSFNTTLSMIRDGKNNIWIGTNGGTISRIQPNSFQHFTQKQGLSKNWVTRIVEDSKGNIWLGTAYGGAVKYDGQNFTHFTEKEGLSHNFVISIMEDSKGNIWFATRDKGVSCFDGKTFTNYAMEQGLSFNYVWDMHEDAQGHIWFACGRLGGMTRFNPENGRFTHYIGREHDKIGGGNIKEDQNQNLWFGGSGCVTKYNSSSDQIEFVYKNEELNEKWLEFFKKDDKGNVWFNGQNCFVQMQAGQANKFSLFTKENGLPDLFLGTMVEDDKQNIWMGTDKGLAVLPGGIENLGHSKAQWLQYGKADGLISNEYLLGAYIDSKNRIWFASVSAGVAMLDLNAYKLPTEAPHSLQLSGIEIQRQFINYNKLPDTSYSSTLDFRAELNSSVDEIIDFYNIPAKLDLPYNLNHLTLHFAAIDWGAPHQIKYSYKMEGLDNDWSEASVEAKADYRNMPYGTYSFKVKAIGKAQVWTAPFEYNFTIRPPWWHTWWAYALYVILGIGTIGWYIQRLRRQIRNKQEQVEREKYLNQELTELNVANSRFVPHQFLQLLGKKSLKELQLGDQTAAKMTILFADIRDYTTLSETMTPEENFQFINAFLGNMGPIIQQNGGFICQYLGDGFMALFKDDHASAVHAAIQIQQSMQRYNQKRFVRNRQALRLGIGLNTGKLMLGVIGDQNRYESSVISDAVNTASRMEGLTKIFGCSVIVSEKTLAEIGLLDTFPESSKLEASTNNLPGTGPARQPDGKASPNYRFLGKVKVKGKNRILKIYDFFEGDTAHIRQLKTTTKADFEKAVHYYFDRKFGKAADLFKAIAEKFPEDIATEFYLARAVKFVIDGVETNWSGAEEMVSK